MDLAITDVESASVSVASAIADHASIIARLGLSIPRVVSHQRQVWSFVKADWDGPCEELNLMDWSASRVGNASLAAALTTSLALEVAAKHIPQRELQKAKRSHPWLTDDIGYADAVKACSAAIMTEYSSYCTRARQMLVAALRG